MTDQAEKAKRTIERDLYTAGSKDLWIREARASIENFIGACERDFQDGLDAGDIFEQLTNPPVMEPGTPICLLSFRFGMWMLGLTIAAHQHYEVRARAFMRSIA